MKTLQVTKLRFYSITYYLLIGHIPDENVGADGSRLEKTLSLTSVFLLISSEKRESMSKEEWRERRSFGVDYTL